jgi:hypothetical protein
MLQTFPLEIANPPATSPPDSFPVRNTIVELPYQSLAKILLKTPEGYSRL